MTLATYLLALLGGWLGGYAVGRYQEYLRQITPEWKHQLKKQLLDPVECTDPHALKIIRDLEAKRKFLTSKQRTKHAENISLRA